jgi:hypothetical protein
LTDLTVLRCGALTTVLRGALTGILEAGAAFAAGLAAALAEVSVLAALALGAEEMVVSFMVYCLSKKLTVHTVYTVVFYSARHPPQKSGEISSP